VWLARRALTDDLGANPIEELEIQTGLWTLRFLALTLAVTPVRRLTRWNWLVKHRRTLGLVAFSYACVHLSMYIGLDMFFDLSDIIEDVAEHLYITAGMAAFLLMIPLAVTSTKNAIRRLGRRWKRLHRLVWAVAFLGTLHFLWAVKKDIREPLIYAGIFAGLLLLRLPLPAKGRSVLAFPLQRTRALTPTRGEAGAGIGPFEEESHGRRTSEPEPRRRWY
jgi:sulfoxide reductase heme-binding subunit YedZ